MILLAALIGGGGGTLSPTSEMILELVVAGILIGALAFDSFRSREPSPAQSVDRRALLLIIVLAGLPWLQLVPLPPSLWQALPGRERAVEALSLVGAGEQWMPWSMTPSRTLGAALAMLPPAVLFLLAIRQDVAGRSLLLATAVAGCIASVLLGALQLTGDTEGSWRLYEMSHLGWLTGFQANRNAQADVLLCGLLALAALYVAGPSGDGDEEHDHRGWATGAAVVAGLLVLGTVLTGSRMGVALLAVAMPLAILAVWQGSANRARFPSPLRLAMAAAVPTIAIAGLLQLPTIQRVVNRFLDDGDSRAAIWSDTRFAIGQYWPAGSGIGSFEPIFAANESLENVGTKFQAHAHSDWLEFALETGLVGAIVLAGAACLFGWLFVRGMASRLRGTASRTESAHLIAGFGILVIIGLHSLVDYPLRSMSLACLAAIAAAMHFPVMTSYRPRTGESSDWTPA